MPEPAGEHFGGPIRAGFRKNLLSGTPANLTSGNLWRAAIAPLSYTLPGPA